jgi:hypothetical protein
MCWSGCLLPFCLLLYFSLPLRACITQSGIYVINANYFPVNIGTRWLEKGIGKHNVSCWFVGFLSLILRKLNVYKMQTNEWLEHLYRFNVYGSMHRKYIPVYIQQYAMLHSLFMYGNCATCFGWYLHPSSGVHTTVSTASHRYCYLPLAAGSSNGVTNTRCCRYSC